MISRPLLLASALLTLLVAAPSAQAQERDADLDRARALFDEAGELEREGRWSVAQERLSAALRIRETANLRYALGWALENDGKRAEARSEYETARRLATHAGNEDVRRLATSRIAEIDRKPTAVTAGVPTSYDAKPTSSPLPWIFVGSGGALLIGSVFLLVSSSGDTATRDDNSRKWCNATACSETGVATRPETVEAAAFRREAHDATNRGNTKQVASAVLGGLGALAVGAGVYMLITRTSREAPSRATRLTVDASPLAGGASASATLVF